jgi:hypothetical protein
MYRSMEMAYSVSLTNVTLCVTVYVVVDEDVTGRLLRPVSKFVASEKQVYTLHSQDIGAGGALA